MIIDKMADNRAVVGILSQRPFNPIGHRRITIKIGNNKAVDIEMIEAKIGCSMAAIKLCVAKENHLVI